jgi:rhamnogalacturonan acetylesterase
MPSRSQFLRILIVLTLLNGITFSHQANPSPNVAGNQARLPTLFIIGDSTVKNSTKGLLGWGDPIAGFFDQSKLKVENRARGGRSSRTFFTEGLWDQVLSGLQRGDFVLMQFGHNDGGAINDDSRARGSLKGTGNEAEEIDNLLTKKHEVVHTFGWYMRKYLADTKAKGAIPIVLSPIPRNIWQDGKVVRASSDYGKWAAEIAKSEGAFFIDLNELVARRYDALGPHKVKELYFGEDHTHTTPAGAQVNAEAVVEGLKSLVNCPLKSFLMAKASSVAPLVLEW